MKRMRKQARSVWLSAVAAELPSRAIAPLVSGMRILAVGVSIAVTATVGVALAATVLQYDVFVIEGGSMAPSVPAGALVIAERIAPEKLDPGQVITFRRASAPDSPVTHRVVRIEETETGVAIWTKGDANDVGDAEPLRGSEPISLVRVSLPLAGYVLAFLRTLPGQLLLIVLPILIVVFRRVSALVQGRRVLAGRATTTEDREQVATDRLTRIRVPLTRRGPMRSLNVLSLLGGREHVEETAQSPRTLRMRQVVEAPLHAGQHLSAELSEALVPLDRLHKEIAKRSNELEASLDRAMRPIIDYADQLEANLKKLEAQLEAMKVTPGSPLDVQVTAERSRLAEVRQAIEASKEPIRARIRAEAHALDAVLAPLEPDLRSLELLQQQQRRHM